MKVSHIGVTLGVTSEDTSEDTDSALECTKTMWCEVCSVKWRIKMLFTLLLTALTATSGEDTHYSEGEGHLLSGGCVPSSLQV